MLYFIPAISLLIFALIGAGFLLRSRRRLRRTLAMSDVCRQHVYLFRGGHISESTVQSTRVALEGMLQRQEIDRVEAALRPGKQFAVQVRALTEINSETARTILERQLGRQLSADPLEQAWYRLDLAGALRRMNRLQSLPLLIRTAATAEGPLSHFLAAEVACFPCFSGFMHQIDEPLGRSALQVLLRALRGLRYGVEPRVVASSRMGEAISLVWDQRLEGVDPLMVRLFAEVVRFLNRTEHAERWFDDDEPARQAFCEQIEHLTPLADAMTEFLEDADEQLLDQLVDAAPEEQEEILRALIDLRADTAATVVPMLEAQRIQLRELAVDSLANSRDESVGHWLCEWARRGKAEAGFPRHAILRVLRHHPSKAAECILVEACGSRDLRTAVVALGSLGWWAPVRGDEVLARLQAARVHPSLEVQSAAQAALARLGERKALRWFRQQLAGEQSEPIHRVIQLVAEEGITLLWADLDSLADADDVDIAYHAREALEQLREGFSFSTQPR